MASIFTRLGKHRQGPGCDCLPAVSIRSQSLATELKSQPDDYGRHKNRVHAAGQPLEQPGGRPMRECRALQRDERDRQQPCAAAAKGAQARHADSAKKRRARTMLPSASEVMAMIAKTVWTTPCTDVVAASDPGG